MPIDFEDDLNEMFAEDDHGTTAYHKGRAVSGIFNNEFYEQSQGVGVESSEPAFYTTATAAESILRNDVLKIEHRDYVVVGRQPDKTGVMRLVLRDA